MNKRRSILVTMMASLAVVLMLVLALSTSGAAAQGPTAPEKISGPSGPATSVGSGFTYQGTLKENGVPANGLYDFRFDLYSGPICCTLSWMIKSNVSVVNGLFTVQLDFGANTFNGEIRYLSVLVRHAGSSTFTLLSPNQELTAAPYALSLMPGAVISGTAYQELKVENYAPTGGIPAGVTGEIYNALDGIGLFGINYAASYTGTGVYGQQGTGSLSTRHGGVVGSSILVNGAGVVGEANNGSGAVGVLGVSSSGDAVYGYSATGLAGYFIGNVSVSGNLTKSGGSFKIDDPLDPANKYLYHSFVESPDMKNIYDGVATLDANGEAVVTLPDWFEALNRDFRYQLTTVGGYAPVYVAEEVHDNAFKIAGGKPGLKVSWQVTGIRQDAWANAHRIPVEENKPAQERGLYIHPELFGQPASMSVDHTRLQQSITSTPSIPNQAP